MAPSAQRLVRTEINYNVQSALEYNQQRLVLFDDLGHPVYTGIHQRQLVRTKYIRGYLTHWDTTVDSLLQYKIGCTAYFTDEVLQLSLARTR